MSQFDMDSTSTVCTRLDAQQARSPSEADRQSADRRDSQGSGINEAVEGRASELMQKLYEPVLSPLAEVEKQLGVELKSQHSSLSPVLRHGTQLGGKRLRPAMLLLVGAAVGRISREHVVLGTVIEMVHTATLVHDDVLDEAETRRHVPTINARWNEHTSILIGDYLFAQSFRLAATLPSTEACRMIGEASRLVCEGELRQVLQRNALELDEPTYISIIAGKTAELCKVACQLGARFADADEEIFEAMGMYGYSVGIAFQIADDFLDLCGDDRSVGKTLGTDICQGKMTLPLIRLLQTASDPDRREILEILSGPAEERIPRIRPFLNRSDALDYTMDTAQRYLNQGLECLERLPESDARSSLEAIARFSVHRRF